MSQFEFQKSKVQNENLSRKLSSTIIIAKPAPTSKFIALKAKSQTLAAKVEVKPDSIPTVPAAIAQVMFSQ